MAPSVLFLADPGEDYVADTLFHGLRSVLGAQAVDYPKRDALYTTYPDARRRDLYGRGFTLYGLLPDLRVDRKDALRRAADGDFDAVVFGSIWRDWHWWVELHRRLSPSVRKAVVDGADVQWMYPYGPTWWKTPRGWLLPRAHRQAIYFKREWTPRTVRMRWWGLAPPRVTSALALERIAISIPEEKLVGAVPSKERDFPKHIVDPAVAERLGRHGTGYAFDEEADYVADLQRSRFGVTTRKAGWDALRHYEIAANGALPCFRQLERKPRTCAPHGLQPGVNCLSYSDPDELLRQTGALTDARYAELVAGSLAWAQLNTTRRRAERVLERLGVT